MGKLVKSSKNCILVRLLVFTGERGILDAEREVHGFVLKFSSEEEKKEIGT